MLPVLVTAAVLAPVRVHEAPQIDGVLDDRVWTTIPASDHFIQSFPHDDGAPSEQTTVRIAYDDESVYVAIDCTQRARPVVRLSRRDRVSASMATRTTSGNRACAATPSRVIRRRQRFDRSQRSISAPRLACSRAPRSRWSCTNGWRSSVQLARTERRSVADRSRCHVLDWTLRRADPRSDVAHLVRSFDGDLVGTFLA
jgi:hypothetical protein